MTMIKNLFAATLLVASFGANAADYNLNDFVVNGGVNEDFTVADAGTFTDNFSFYTADVIDWTAVGVSAGTDIASFSAISLTNNDTSAVIYGTANQFNAWFSTAQLSNQDLTAGNYTLSVSGMTEVANVQYTLNVAPISAVPEPSVLGLMFGGLGLVGMVAYRARKTEV